MDTDLVAPKTRNRVMAEALRKGEAKDVSSYRQKDGTYLLPEGFYEDDIDYYDVELERHIWSIGRFSDGSVHAAPDGRYYEKTSKGIECLWLR